MIVSALAPAKINLGLEILGRRPDGYHEIRTILAAVSTVDRLRVSRGAEMRLRVDRPDLDNDQNLVAAAARLMSQQQPAVTPQIELRKRIPAAAGLGGASSDAAAALLAIDRCYGLGLHAEKLESMGADLGSDVPFFFTGGIALASGRGECISPLPAQRTLHVVIVTPKILIPEKTATLYRSLEPADFSDGSRVESLAKITPENWAKGYDSLKSAFERPLYELVPSLRELPVTIRGLGARDVGLSGAGPSHFALETDCQRAHALGARLRVEFGDRAAIHVCRTIAHGVILTEQSGE